MGSHTARKALLVCLVIEACRASMEIEVLRVSLTIVALELGQHSRPWRASPGYCAALDYQYSDLSLECLQSK